MPQMSSKTPQSETARSQQGSAVSSEGAALSPPHYGIDFVDRQTERENNTGLPDHLKAGIENLSGMAMDDVRVHYHSSKPAQLQALAYTQGTEIHMGPGQERHLPHEAWHAVQQKQGRVKPILQAKGVTINVNAALEREADVIGSRIERLPKTMRQPGKEGSLSPGGTGHHCMNCNEAKIRADFPNLPSDNSGKYNGILPAASVNPLGVIQAKFIYKDFPLEPYIDDIAQYLKDNYDGEIVKSFYKHAKNQRLNYKFITWAENRDINWEIILQDVVGFDPDWEKDLFGERIAESGKMEGGRMKGHPLTGLIPTHPETEEEMLEQVPRSGVGKFDYTQDEDHRTLQLLRQISTQLYLYLQVNKKLAAEEQEIQTMWTHGNLIIGSNQLETAANLYKELTSSGKNDEQLYTRLTGKYAPKSYLGTISERHGKKINTLYQGIREYRLKSPEILKILQNLFKGSIKLITDVTDDKQVKEFADNSGGIYIMSAKSPAEYSHAEQRLIEFRDIVHAYKADPKAWVAGKKRPCFGCWIREILINKKGDYKLIYQDQPGKAFINTYRAAPPPEKKEWVKKSKEKDLTVYESEVGSGEIGPESESEAEEEMSWNDPNVFFDDIGKEKLKKNKRTAVAFHFDQATTGDKVNFLDVESYLKKRVRDEDQIDSDAESSLENASKKLKSYATTSPNPALPKIFGFTVGYKKEEKKKKKKKVKKTI